MIIRRMLQILFFCVLLSACKPSLEDISTAYDIYEKSGPLITAVVEDLKPTPTFGLSQPIEDYFVLASSPNCESIIQRVDNIDPVQSIVCRDADITVRYDNWHITATMDDYHKNILESPGTTVTKNTTWSDNGNQDQLGNFYEFIDSEGNANIIWTITTHSISLDHLSGWAIRADNNQAVLFKWWAETGSDHK